jgi:DNA invertase Pin-like site-specific DNA recombinase
MRCVSLTPKVLDTMSAAGKMIFRMLAVLAQFERDLISERTTSAMSHLRQSGRRISGRVLSLTANHTEETAHPDDTTRTPVSSLFSRVSAAESIPPTGAPKSRSRPC